MALPQMKEIDDLYADVPPAQPAILSSDAVERLIFRGRSVAARAKQEGQRAIALRERIEAAAEAAIRTEDQSSIGELLDSIERGHRENRSARAEFAQLVEELQRVIRGSDEGLLRFSPGQRRAIRRSTEKALETGQGAVARINELVAVERDLIDRLFRIISKPDYGEAESPPDPWPPQ